MEEPGEGWGAGPWLMVRKSSGLGCEGASLWEEPAFCSQGQARRGRHKLGIWDWRLSLPPPAPPSLGFPESLQPRLRLNKFPHNTSSPTTCLAEECKLSL